MKKYIRMDSIVKVKRIFRNENDLTGKGETKRVDSIIDLSVVSDCEEYGGELGKPDVKYTIVLCEYELTTEYKIIEMEFNKFCEIYMAYRKYAESKVGITKLN